MNWMWLDDRETIGWPRTALALSPAAARRSVVGARKFRWPRILSSDRLQRGGRDQLAGAGAVNSGLGSGFESFEILFLSSRLARTICVKVRTPKGLGRNGAPLVCAWACPFNSVL